MEMTQMNGFLSESVNISKKTIKKINNQESSGKSSERESKMLEDKENMKAMLEEEKEIASNIINKERKLLLRVY